MENTKITCPLFKGSWVLVYFLHSNWHNLSIFWKICKTTLFRNPPTEVYQNTSTFISIRPHITKYGHFQNIKTCISFFKIKTADILNFQWIKYLGKGLSYFKNWGLWVNYCWNYGSAKLLLHFIKYSLDQLNNKHTKLATNSTIQYFEGCSLKRNVC